MKKCQHCAEMIRDEAAVCPYCTRNVAPHARRALAMTIVGGSLVALFLLATAANSFFAGWERAERRAALTQMTGGPPPSEDEKRLLRKKAIFNAAHSTSVEDAARRYETTVDDVRAIVEDGKRQGWTPR